MRGVVNYSSLPGSVEIRELPVPQIGEDDVLLAVQAVGVCGSDIHQAKGQQSWRVNYLILAMNLAASSQKSVRTCAVIGRVTGS